MDSAFLALVAFPTFTFGPVQNPRPEEELARLAEAVGSAEAFTARYSISIDGVPAGTLEFAYLAPDKAAAQASVDGETSSVWCVDGIVTILNSGEKGAEWSQIDVQAAMDELANVSRALNAQFDEIEGPHVEQLRPVLHIHLEGEEERPRFRWSTHIETPWESFCWLDKHRGLYRETALHPEHVAFHPFGGVLNVAHEKTLFPDEDKNRRVEMLLVDFRLEVDKRRLRVPHQPDNSGDSSEESASLKATLSYETRMDIHRRVGAALADGSLNWDEDTQNHLATVLKTGHRHWIASYHGEWIQGMLDYLVQLEGWALEATDNGVGQDELKEHLASRKAELEKTLSTWRRRIHRLPAVSLEERVDG